MSVSKAWVGNTQNQKAVLRAYRDLRALMTVEQIAEDAGTTFHNVRHVLSHYLPAEEYRLLKVARYSASKTSWRSLMYGKTGEAHHNWKGVCEDGYGYLTCLWDGKRVFLHSRKVAEALGLKSVPKGFVVHHIDEDPTNNSIDNLALCTAAGHRQIHVRQTREPDSLRLKRSTIAEILRSST